MIAEHYIIIVLWILGGDLTANAAIKLVSGRPHLIFDNAGKIALILIFIFWPFVAFLGLGSRVLRK